MMVYLAYIPFSGSLNWNVFYHFTHNYALVSPIKPPLEYPVVPPVVLGYPVPCGPPGKPMAP